MVTVPSMDFEMTSRVSSRIFAVADTARFRFHHNFYPCADLPDTNIAPCWRFSSRSIIGSISSRSGYSMRRSFLPCVRFSRLHNSILTVFDTFSSGDSVSYGRCSHLQSFPCSIATSSLSENIIHPVLDPIHIICESLNSISWFVSLPITLILYFPNQYQPFRH